MLDIDFLAGKHLSLRQHVVYTYSTGLLRGPVRRRLEQLYTAKELICGDADSPDLLSSIYWPSLLGTQALFIDSICHPDLSTILPVFLPDLETKVIANSLIFFIPEAAPIRQAPFWRAFAKTATVIEEARLSKTALPKLVAFFGSGSGVFDLRQLTNPADLLAALQETLKFESQWTLIDFHKRLEFLALTCVTDRTFDKVLFRKYAPPATTEDFYRFHKALFEFLLQKTPDKLIRVVGLFSQEYVSQQNARMLVGQLHMITRDFLAVNLKLNPKGEVPEDWSAYKKQRLMAYKGLPTLNLYLWI
jgi:hypothetical protein